MKKRWIILLAFIVLIIAIGIFLYWWSRLPAQGSINISVADNQVARTAGITTQTLSGKYFSFEYPSSVTLKKHDLSETEEESILLFSSTGSSEQLAITYRRTGANNLSDIPAVIIREEEPDIYDLIKFNLAEKPGLFSTKLEGPYEKIIFVIKDNFVLTLAHSAPTRVHHEELAKNWESVLASFKWL